MFRKVILAIFVLSVSIYGDIVRFGDIDYNEPIQPGQYIVPITSDVSLVSLNAKIKVIGDAELVSVTGVDDGQDYGWEEAFSADAEVINNQAIMVLGSFEGSLVGTVAQVVVDYTGPRGFTVTIEPDTSFGGSFSVNGPITGDSITDTVEAGDNDPPQQFTLNSSITGRYPAGGTIVASSVVYDGDVVNVTAITAPGYRVSRWFGTDSRDPLNNQTVTIRRNNQSVRVAFEPVPEAEITRAVFKAGKTRESSTDSFVISGVLGAGANEVPEQNGTMQMRILSDEDDVLFDTGTVGLNSDDVRFVWPRSISYTNREISDGNLNLFSYSMVNGRFNMKAVGQDLTGWSSPLYMEITIGDYSEMLELADGDDDGDDVINGRGYMPGEFMIGQTDAVTADTVRVRYNQRTELSSGTIKGRVVTTGNMETVANCTIMIDGWESEPLELTKSRRGNIYSYRRPRTADRELEYITAVAINFDKATYIIKFSGADLGEIESDLLELEMDFGWIDE